MRLRHRLMRSIALASELLPRSRRLRFRIAWGRRLGQCESELRDLVRVAGRGRVAVDAGANEGWYSCELAKLFDRVVAIEPNQGLVNDLRSADLVNVEILTVALSNREGDAMLHIPVRRGIPLSGWASVDPGHLEAAESLERLGVRTLTLDSLALEHLDFLKIDVEGHEVEVIEGGRETLERCRPRVLVEVQARNEAKVESLLEECGLRRCGRGTDFGLSPDHSLFVDVGLREPPVLRDH
jgi:FkbM family methyltransferase